MTYSRIQHSKPHHKRSWQSEMKGEIFDLPSISNKKYTTLFTDQTQAVFHNLLE